MSSAKSRVPAAPRCVVLAAGCFHLPGRSLVGFPLQASARGRGRMINMRRQPQALTPRSKDTTYDHLLLRPSGAGIAVRRRSHQGGVSVEIDFAVFSAPRRNSQTVVQRLYSHVLGSSKLDFSVIFSPPHSLHSLLRPLLIFLTFYLISFAQTVFHWLFRSSRT